MIVEQSMTSGVVQWRLSNEARRNAIGPDALHWIAERAPRLAGEVVLVTGAGTEAFCAGFDLNALTIESGMDLPDAPLVAATEAMVGADATFVAVLQGYAIGAGVELACTCDLRLACAEAFFLLPAARIGVVYHGAGLARIRGVFGEALTQRLLLVGESISAGEALAAGALTKVVARHELAATALELAVRVRDAAPLSTRAHRGFLRAARNESVPPAAAQAHEQARNEAYASSDHREGRAAVLEGRSPRFRGC